MLNHPVRMIAREKKEYEKKQGAAKKYCAAIRIQMQSSIYCGLEIRRLSRKDQLKLISTSQWPIVPYGKSKRQLEAVCVTEE